MSEDDFLLESAKLGIEAEAFVRSSLGQYMLERADMEIEYATVELIAADPEDGKVNRDIRSKIAVASSIKEWIVEAIESGQVAIIQINDNDAESPSHDD